MKIAFLSFYSGLVSRGVEAHTHELANRLHNKGHDIVVFQVGKKLPDSKYETRTIPIDINWGRKSSYFPLFNYWSLKVRSFTKKVLKNINSDTDVVVPTNGQWQGIMSSAWTKKRKKRMVIIGHSGSGLDDRINLYTFPNCFIALSTSAKTWAKKTNPLVHVEKVPNGVDITKFSEKGEKIEINLPKPIILSVAALNDWKRLDLAIKAVSKLKKGSLLIVGSGSKDKVLENLAKRKLSGRFKIMSFPYTDMPNVYRSVDLFTYPTVPWESFGIVLLEAMASGLPVIATKDPIRDEIVGDAGILIDPTDTEAYAKAIKKALSTNWGNKPRSQAKKFDWDIIAKKYEEILKNL